MTLDDFNQVMGILDRMLKRAPEVIMQPVSHFISHLTIDISKSSFLALSNVLRQVQQLFVGYNFAWY